MTSPRVPLARLAALLGILTCAACGGAEPTVAEARVVDRVAPDDARGGRLFDRWTAEAPNASFFPDAPDTVGVADGRGGPRGDGTLVFGDGRVLFNDDGHDYRLKNLFGWDLRGASGIYGSEHMAKPAVLASNLLEWPGGVAEIADRLERGDATTPAFGAVLDRADLEAIAAFVVNVRDGVLPRPDAIFTLSSPEAGHYALRGGGDAARGRALFADRCAGCHGRDGTARLFDGGEYSLGSHVRQKAYEDWLKILNGAPGTPMGRQVTGEDGAAMAQELLDLFAALCDRQAFPRGAASGDDVDDGDPRCGAYLR